MKKTRSFCFLYLYCCYCSQFSNALLMKTTSPCQCKGATVVQGNCWQDWLSFLLTLTCSWLVTVNELAWGVVTTYTVPLRWGVSQTNQTITTVCRHKSICVAASGQPCRLTVAQVKSLVEWAINQPHCSTCAKYRHQPCTKKYISLSCDKSVILDKHTVQHQTKSGDEINFWWDLP